MKKNLAKIGMFALVIGSFISLSAHQAMAAADADLATALASTTSIVTDNKSQILLFFVGIVGFVIIIGVAIALMLRAKRMIVGSVAGGKRRR